MPKALAYTGDKGYRLSDVEAGKVSMDEFLAQLSDKELACIVRGEGMCSPKVTACIDHCRHSHENVLILLSVYIAACWPVELRTAHSSLDHENRLICRALE